jgi:hypothetical protein
MLVSFKTEGTLIVFHTYTATVMLPLNEENIHEKHRNFASNYAH